MTNQKAMKTSTSIKSVSAAILFFSSTFLTAQSNESTDSPHWLKFDIPPEILEYQFQLDNNFPSYFLPESVLNDTTSVWIRTRMMLSNFQSDDRADQVWETNILNPLQERFRKSQSMKIWNTILGSVQAGAAGYLAYKHLKKYGFLKKK